MSFSKLFLNLYRSYTKEFYGVFIIAVLGGAAEFINLAILQYVVTSLSSLTSNSSLVTSNPTTKHLILLLIFSTCVVLCCRILVLRTLTFGSNRLGSEIAMNSISQKITERVISGDFKSSTVSATTSKALNLVNMVIYPTFLTISSISSILLIFAAFLYVNLIYSIVIMLTGLFTFSLFITLRRQFFKTADINVLQDKHAQTILGIIKCKIEILTYDIWENFNEKLRAEDQFLRKNFAAVHFFMQLPRVFIDSLVILAGLSIFWLHNQQLINQDTVTHLVIFGVGFMRLIPQLLQCIQALTTIRAYGSTFEAFISPKASTENQSGVVFDILAKDELAKIWSRDRIRLSSQLKKFDHVGLNANDEVKIIKGRKYLLRGPSGIGKSTLINKFVGISSQNDIPIYLNNQPNLKIAYCPQFPGILPGNVSDNIKFGRKGIPPEDINNIAQTLKLDPSRSVENEDSLSGGEITRVSLARGLVAKPEILLLDETLAPLSEEYVTEILELLNSQQNLTVLAIMHSENFDRFFDEVINMSIR